MGRVQAEHGNAKLMETFPVAMTDLGRTRYREVLRAMQAFTDGRDQDTEDAFWLTEHEPVFTQGQAGKAEHLLAPGGIEVVQSDRGGQITYHGPGQIVGYLLFDIRRMGVSVRGLVSGIEQAIIAVLAAYGISGAARPDAPGVYVAGAKIAALGLRVRRGCSYHGFAFNLDMDLQPFARINPCGMADLAVTQLRDLCGETSPAAVKAQLAQQLQRTFPVSLRTPGSLAASPA